MSQHEVTLSRGASGDISKLAIGTDRAEVALNALNEENLSPKQIADLAKLAKKYERLSTSSSKAASTATAPTAAIELAEKILSSLEIGKDGFAKLVIPANVRDLDAMKALNLYFKKNLPGMNRPAIWEGDFDWYAKLASVSSRDISKERHIEINVLVDDTLRKSRSNQIKVLKSQDLTLGAPEEVALVVAAYACKNQGKDLLNDNWTRTVVSGVALATIQNCGVLVSGRYDVNDLANVGASGVRSRPN